MPNTIITPGIIAKEALMQLENNIVMGKLVHREYREDFTGGVGDQISVRKPVKFVASDGAARVNQDVEEASTPFTIDKRKHVSWKFATKDLTLSIEQYSERYIRPAMIALANQVDSDLCALHTGIFQNVGDNATPETFLEFGAASTRLDEAAVPSEDRRLVLNPQAHLYAANLLKGLYNPELVKGAVRGISVGPLAGFQTYMDQNVKRHTEGTWGTTPLVAGAGQAVTYANASHSYGSTSQTLTIDGLTATTGTVKKGDKFTLANVYAVNPVSKETLGFLQEFVANTDVTADGSGAATLNISPAIITSGPFQTVSGAPADNAVITRVGTHTANLAFHKNAFGLVTVPLELPDGAAFKARESHKGYSVRVVKDYDIDTDEDVIRLDIMYGVKTLYPELACVLRG